MFRVDDINVVRKAATLESDVVSGPHRAKHLIFADERSLALLTMLDRVAPSNAPVLISGETGTGKELIARYVHRESGRQGPFLAVNCGAISEQLAESELFGHEAGAFTGANVRREGWFEAANGGTLFLDEIGDMPLHLQGRLLRVLQEGEVTRIGSRRSTAVDVRIVSASNVDLTCAVEQGRFRRDLLYRLNIVPVRLPSLRERPGDIEALTDNFIRYYAARMQRAVPRIEADALEALKRHSWPGNIRELENVLHYSMLMLTHASISAKDLRLPAIAARHSPVTAHTGKDERDLDGVGRAVVACFDSRRKHLLRDIERRVVQDAFRHCHSNQVQTAELLGVSRNVIRTLLKRYGLIGDGDPPDADQNDLQEGCEFSC